MQIEITPGTVTVAAISGSIDSLTAEHLMAAFATTVSAQMPCLVADFREVVYTSSAGLRALLAALGGEQPYCSSLVRLEAELQRHRGDRDDEPERGHQCHSASRSHRV